MDPFTIYCETCASRLKVRSPSAIGQRLACPKCGNMILVDAPVDFAPPETELPESTAGVGKSKESWESEFEEIDQILAINTERATAKPSKQIPRKRPTSNLQKTRNHPATVHREANPVLPNEQWTAQSTQQRRKWLMQAAGMVSLLVLATAVVMAVTANWSRPPTEVANNTPDKNNDSNGLAIEKVAPVESTEPVLETELKVGPENLADSSRGPSNGLPDEKNGVPADPEEDSILPSEVPIRPLDPGDSGTEPSASNGNRGNPGSVPVDATTAKPPVNPSPFGPDFERFLELESQDTASGETNFSEFSAALENSGSSVFEINQWASVAQRRRVGVQKYFIGQPDPIDGKNLKRLDDSIAGVKYSGQLLTQILAEMTQITGVPISFDAEILQLENFDFGYRIESIEATDTSFRAVIEMVLDEYNRQSDKRELILEYDGAAPATITVQEGRVIRTESIALPTLSNPDQESKERLVILIQQLIAPESWNRENQTYSLIVDGANLSVTHHPSVIHQISEFCRKWNVALAVREGKSNTESLGSRWFAASTSLRANFEGVPKFEIPIQIFLTQLQQQTGVNVIVDWNSLIAAGWNPNTKIASGFDEPTIGDILDELTHSMNVGWRVINANTFEITSNDVVEETILLEFYSCAKILSGTLNAEQLVLSVKQALQSANRNLDRARIHFEAETQCFIVVAPDSVHRQIEAIVSRLRESQN